MAFSSRNLSKPLLNTCRLDAIVTSHCKEFHRLIERWVKKYFILTVLTLPTFNLNSCPLVLVLYEMETSIFLFYPSLALFCKGCKCLNHVPPQVPQIFSIKLYMRSCLLKSVEMVKGKWKRALLQFNGKASSVGHYPLIWKEKTKLCWSIGQWVQSSYGCFLLNYAIGSSSSIQSMLSGSIFPWFGH